MVGASGMLLWASCICLNSSGVQVAGDRQNFDGGLLYEVFMSLSISESSDDDILGFGIGYVESE